MKFSTLFVDGTHENFSLIKQYEEENFHGGPGIYIIFQGEKFTT